MPLLVSRGRRAAPDRILLMGVEGIGKTTFAAGAPAPIWIDLEDGSNHLDVARLPRPTTLHMFHQLLAQLLAEPHEFKTVVIDTIDALEALIVRHVCTENDWFGKDGTTPDIEKPGYGKGYMPVLEEWRRILVALERLGGKGMEVILIAHTAIKTFNNPTGPDYQRYEPKLIGSTNAKPGALIKEWCRAVLFAIHEEIVRPVNKTQPQGRAKATSTGARVVHTERTAAWDAKNRHGLPATLPLDYAAYAEAREKGPAGNTEALLAEAEELLSVIPDDRARAYVQANRDNPVRLANAVNKLRTMVPSNATQNQEAPHAAPVG